jgi:hypothetical protein
VLSADGGPYDPRVAAAEPGSAYTGSTHGDITTKLKQIAVAALFGGALIAASAAIAQAQEKLAVWWGKGFY